MGSPVCFARCRVILAGLFSAREADPEGRLDEAAAAIVAKGGVVVARVIQRRGVSRARSPGGAARMDAPMDPGTFFGRGKATEIARLRATVGGELVLVVGKLSPAQRKNLEGIVGCPVVDVGAMA